MFQYPLLIAALCAFLSCASYAQDIENDQILPITYTIKKGETLYKIALSFDLGVGEILQANPKITDREKIYSGKKIILPVNHLLPNTRHEGIVVNLAELRLYFFKDGEVMTFPVGIGIDKKTPTGRTKIDKKREKPSWIPTDSMRKINPQLPKIVEAGPDNPLGEYALYLDASKNFKWQNIAIHGTNEPWSVGFEVSHGCMRLYPKDIEILFDEVEIDTPIRIINQPIKINKINNQIYFEVNFKDEDSVLDNSDVSKLICEKIKDCENKIDWQKVDEAVEENLGIPVRIDKF